jgi:hypothetical protein
MGGQVFHSLPDRGRLESPGVRYVPAERPPAVLSDLDARSEQAEDVPAAPAELGAAPPPVEEQLQEDIPPGASRRDESEVVPPPSVEEPEAEERQRVTQVTAPMSQAQLTSGRTQDAAELRFTRLGAQAVDSISTTELMEAEFMKVEGAPSVVGVNPDSLERSLAVPGLLVETIEWEERVPGVKALLIRQLLPPSDTLELRYLGLLLGTDPQPARMEQEPVARDEVSGGRRYANVLEASLPPGWNQVVMERERGLLVARATIHEAQLKALLKSLH